MKARSVARELALLIWFQTPDTTVLQKDKTERFEELIAEAVRTLSTYAEERLDEALPVVENALATIQQAQDDHLDNEDIPYQLPTNPVPLPNTKVMAEALNDVIQAANLIAFGLDLPEMIILSDKEHVQNYVKMLLNSLLDNQDWINANLQAALVDWKLERLNKIDRALMEMATAEMIATDSVEVPTIIDECLNLTKRYSDLESHKLINGTLSTVAKQIQTELKTERV
jgi:N utilization substance protein B